MFGESIDSEQSESRPDSEQSESLLNFNEEEDAVMEETAAEQPTTSTGKQKATSAGRKRKAGKVPEVDTDLEDLMAKIQRLESEEKDECDIFGELIASELETLDHCQMLNAKHQIQNVIFKLRMQKATPMSSSLIQDPYTEYGDTTTKKNKKYSFINIVYSC